jgi:hypothetical protein
VALTATLLIGGFAAPALSSAAGATTRAADSAGTSGSTSQTSATPAGTGYWVLDAAGDVSGFGGASTYAPTPPAAAPTSAVAIAATPDGEGYDVLTKTGEVVPFGDATDYGSLVQSQEQSPVGLVVTPDGRGYWILSADDVISPFGDATGFGGPTPATGVSAVAMAATPDGDGYWVLTSDGSVDAFGDATGFGGPTPVTGVSAVAMAATPDGGGYWVLTSDGNVYAFGDATAYGSLPAADVSQGPVGLAPTTDGEGYWIVTATGTVVGLGDAVAAGSVTSPPAEVVAVAAQPPATDTAWVKAGSPTGSAINEQLVGFDTISDDGEGPLLQNIGTAWADQQVNFQADIPGTDEPSYNCDGPWNSEYTDQEVNEAQASAARVMLDIDYTPTCLASDVPPGGSPSYAPPDVGKDAARWRQLVEQMAEHEIADEGVTAYEVWAEPDGGVYWTGTEAQYDTLYKNTVKALEAAAEVEHTTIEIGGPSLTNINLTWLNTFVHYVKAHHLPLNFVAFALYADQAPIPESQQALFYAPVTEAIRDDVDKILRRSHPLIMIDEWNYSSHLNYPELSTSTDAAFASATLSNQQAGGVNFATFFSSQDFSSSANYGVLAAGSDPDTWVPKPVYYSFLAWHDMAGDVVPLSVTPSQPLNDFGGEASTSNGTVYVLLYDFGTVSGDGSVNVAIGGLSPGTYSVQEALTDSSDLDTVVPLNSVTGPWAKIPVTFNGAGTALLTLTPTAGSSAST